MSSSHIFLVVVLALACVSDLRTRRIPNVLTLSAVVAALIFHLVTGGWTAAGWSIAGCVLGVFLFFPMFALRGMGAGDVKLLAAVGAWLGPSQVLTAALMTSIAGGGIALVVAFSHGYLKTAYRNLWMLLTTWRITGVRPVDELTLESARGPRLAYALPMAIGTLATLWLKSAS